MLDARIASLPVRDRRALFALLIFLALCLVYMLFAVHQYAGKVERQAMTVQNHLFWMRSQAPFIQTEQAHGDSLQERIQTRARQQGMTVKVIEVGSRAQLSVNHDNAAVVGNFLTGLAKEGMVFDRLAINQQVNFEILAEATVRNAS